jgi:hypothetical protein
VLICGYIDPEHDQAVTRLRVVIGSSVDCAARAILARRQQVLVEPQGESGVGVPE